MVTYLLQLMLNLHINNGAPKRNSQHWQKKPDNEWKNKISLLLTSSFPISDLGSRNLILVWFVQQSNNQSIKTNWFNPSPLKKKAIIMVNSIRIFLFWGGLSRKFYVLVQMKWLKKIVLLSSFHVRCCYSSCCYCCFHLIGLLIVITFDWLK